MSAAAGTAQPGETSSTIPLLAGVGLAADSKVALDKRVRRRAGNTSQSGVYIGPEIRVERRHVLRGLCKKVAGIIVAFSKFPPRTRSSQVKGEEDHNCTRRRDFTCNMPAPIAKGQSPVCLCSSRRYPVHPSVMLDLISPPDKTWHI